MAPVALILPVISPGGGVETDSSSSSINFKEMIERNPDLKTIAKNYCVLILGFKNKVAASVQQIDCHLLDLKELGLEIVASSHDYNWLIELFPDDLELSSLLMETTNLIRRQQDRISELLQSVEGRRRVYNFAIMIVVIITLSVSFGFAVARERQAALGTDALARAIKAVETYLNVMLSDEERVLKEEKEVVDMMRYGECLLVHELDELRRQAKTLKEEIMAERSKLMEKPEILLKTIIKMECKLKELQRIIKGYGNKLEEFGPKFTNMVRN